MHRSYQQPAQVAVADFSVRLRKMTTIAGARERKGVKSAERNDLHEDSKQRWREEVKEMLNDRFHPVVGMTRTKALVMVMVVVVVVVTLRLVTWPASLLATERHHHHHNCLPHLQVSFV